MSYDDLISPAVKKLAKRKTCVSLEEYKKLRLNSFEREFLFAHLDGEALLWVLAPQMKRTREEIGSKSTHSYGHALCQACEEAKPADDQGHDKDADVCGLRKAKEDLHDS